MAPGVYDQFPLLSVTFVVFTCTLLAVRSVILTVRVVASLGVVPLIIVMIAGIASRATDRRAATYLTGSETLGAALIPEYLQRADQYHVNVVAVLALSTLPLAVYVLALRLRPPALSQFDRDSYRPGRRIPRHR